MADWFNTTIAGSPIWAGIGFGAVVLIGAGLIVYVAALLKRAIGNISGRMQRKARENSRGYFIAVSPLMGKNAKAMTQTLIDDLTVNMAHFSFGTPINVFRAPRLTPTAHEAASDTARLWLSKNAANIISWGGAHGNGKPDRVTLTLLSREATLTAAEAKLSRIEITPPTEDAGKYERIAAAYLFARALLPGLATATAFRREKIHGVAAILAKCLTPDNALPASTRRIIEADYCRMGLHLGTPEHLKSVIQIRRERLSGDVPLDTETQLQARFDLGRALLLLSQQQFDGARVREAMDHLRVAHDIIRTDARVGLITDILSAIDTGKRLIDSRQRFSVLGGGVL